MLLVAALPVPGAPCSTFFVDVTVNNRRSIVSLAEKSSAECLTRLALGLRSISSLCATDRVFKQTTGAIFRQASTYFNFVTSLDKNRLDIKVNLSLGTGN